jgi:hypothetical protein
VYTITGTTSAVVARKRGGGPVTVAADDAGRLWAVWDDRGGVSASIHARRSNRAATVWGAEVVAKRPGGTLQAYRLDASAIGGKLDVLGVFNLGTSSDAATFHRRLRPGLTLTADRRRLPSGRSSTVTFTVLDAGDPVDDARVKAGGASGRTDRRGRVKLRLPGRAVRVRATAAGYVADALRLRAR